MVLAITTVLLGAEVGAIAVLLAIPKGYLGHRRRKVSVGSAASLDSFAKPMEKAVRVPAAVVTTVAEPAPSPVQAIYETVQPTPAPVQYAAPSVTSFGAPYISRTTTRTYRRRTAPVMRAAAPRASPKAKTKKH